MPYSCLGFEVFAPEEELCASVDDVVAVPDAAAMRPEMDAVLLELLDAERVAVDLAVAVARVVLPEETVLLAESEEEEVEEEGDEDEDPDDEEEEEDDGDDGDLMPPPLLQPPLLLMDW